MSNKTRLNFCAASIAELTQVEGGIINGCYPDHEFDGIVLEPSEPPLIDRINDFCDTWGTPWRS